MARFAQYVSVKNAKGGNKMELSRHAEIRKQQRGFQADDIDLIMSFGTCTRRPGNAVEYQMTHKRKKQLIQALDRVKDKAVLLSDDEKTVMTLYNLDKKRRKGESYGI